MPNETKYVPPKKYGFTEDKIFGWVMENQEFCLYILQIILPDLNIKEIVEFNEQDMLGNDDRQAKDVRLDIKVIDKQGRIFDIEMQTTTSVYLGRRIRYYQSTMDGARILKAGDDYSKLPDTYIIFLCSENPSIAFSRSDNKAVHVFKTIDENDLSLKLNDGSTKVIINSKGDFSGESAELKELAKLMNNEEVNLNEKFIWAQERIKELNQDRRSSIVSYETTKAEWLTEGKGIGMIEGKIEGKNEEHLVGVKKLISALLPMDDVALLTKTRKQYGEYFTDDQLKEFIAEVKDQTLQEA